MKKLLHLSIFFLLVVGLTACPGGNGDGNGDGNGGNSGGDTPDVGNGGAGIAAGPTAPLSATATIRGKVTLKGTPPKMRNVPLSAEKACVKHHKDKGQKPRVETVVAGSKGELANCFVYVSKGVKKKPRASKTPVSLDQRGCIYTPHVVGLQIGQELHVKNNDPLLHNVNALAKNQKGFNQAQIKNSKPIVKKFRKPEVMMRVKCDIHGWMEAWVGVVAHPWFAVTKADGTYQLPKIPPGTYTLTVWHEFYKTLEQKGIQIAEGETESVDFVYTAK